MAVYLIHFQRPFQHANHYLGFVDTSGHPLDEALLTRMSYHRSGRGSRLLKAVTVAGIPWQIVRVWPDGTRTQERQLKGRSSTRLCPTCNPRCEGRGALGGSLINGAVFDLLGLPIP